LTVNEIWAIMCLYCVCVCEISDNVGLHNLVEPSGPLIGLYRIYFSL
jgi:hypothetical protein